MTEAIQSSIKSRIVKLSRQLIRDWTNSVQVELEINFTHKYDCSLVCNFDSSKEEIVKASVFETADPWSYSLEFVAEAEYLLSKHQDVSVAHAKC